MLHLHVELQLVFTCKCFGTEGAREGLQPRVHETVPGQVGRATKGCLTLVTLIWLLSCKNMPLELQLTVHEDIGYRTEQNKQNQGQSSQ